MQQTEQFKLNQWQKDDRILMEDFNADNLKIENALASKLGHIEIIFSHQFPGETMPSYGTALDFDWDKYEYAGYLVQMPQDIAGSGSPIKLSVYEYDKPLAVIPEGSFFLIFWCRHNKELPVEGFVLCSQPAFFSCDVPYKNLNTLRVISTGSKMPSPKYTQLAMA